MGVEELVNIISKEANLNYCESDMLLHDINNLRGNEWLNTVMQSCSKDTIRKFKRIINS